MSELPLQKEQIMQPLLSSPLEKNIPCWLPVNQTMCGSWLCKQAILCQYQLDFIFHKVEDGHRAFNGSILHPAAADGQGRSQSTWHNRKLPHVRWSSRGGKTQFHPIIIFVQIQTLGLSPTHHIVTGASKRGWATWLVGAVDPRVMAIVPVVMDELNFLDNIKHHYRSLGGINCFTLGKGAKKNWKKT